MAQIGNCNNTVSPAVVNDAVCTTISLSDTGGTPTIIYENSSTFLVNGTILIENNGVGASPTAALLIDGVQIPGFVVAPGSSRAYTAPTINTISLIGAGAGTTSIKIAFSLNYRF